jgi:sigma-B regulation protein RsbU (phosphoserine phosphatase)
MSKKNTTSKKVRNKASIAILITAAVLMLLISGSQQYFSRKQIRIDLENNAEMELVVKALSAKHALDDVELALRNRRWEFEQILPYPDSLFAVTRRFVEQNPNFDGCCIAMLPDYYPEKGRLFEPYTVRRGEVIETYQLGSEEHDYSKNIYFTISAENDTSFWSEPYLDEDDPNVTLITYTFPVYDASGRVAGVVGVDLESEWLGKMLNDRHMHPSSYDILISGEGKLICGPEESGNSHQLAKETVTMINDSTLQRHVSSSGYSTLLSFVDKEDGSKGSVFYSSPETLKPWRIAVVNYDDEVFEPLLKTRWRNLFLTLAGLLVFAFIIQRSAKNISKLQQATLEREHIDSELNIARKIQMDMIPKAFPPFPDRNDINIYGSLVPAKMVGGDLYDFFIRDEKLYFCIGDVSGKSVPGALVMAAGYTLYHSLAAHESNPSRIMQAINEAISKDNEANMFVTMFIGVLDLPTGKLRYCNAGHEKPFIIGQKVRVLPVKPHLPLGVKEDVIYTTQEDRLTPGEMVFLYTDGLTEAMNMKHELFGIKRIENVLETFEEQGGILTEALINKIAEKVTAFVGEAEQSDDLTLLAVQYTPQEKPLVLRESLTITNRVSEITKINAFVQSATTMMHMENDLANKIKLAVEETVTNCIEYAYPSGTYGDVTVAIEADDSIIRFIITDSGVEFDPTGVSKADTTLTVDERPIGGLGVFLVRNLMDSINYERAGGKNILRMEKRYSC